MTRFIDVILRIVNIVSFAGTFLFVTFGVYDQITGPADAEKLLKTLHIPLSYNQTLIVGVVCIALMMIGYSLRNKLAGKM